MPHVILQSYTMCVLYANRSDANRGIVLRALHDNTMDLHTIASGSSLMSQEKLARVHALMFYQLIRMLDGDITLGAQADNDMPILETWLDELCSTRDNLDECGVDSLVMQGRLPESWEVCSPQHCGCPLVLY